MEVICIEDGAFYALIEQVVQRIAGRAGARAEVWVDDEEAMRLLNIKSKTTLQKLRDEGKIRYSQPQKKIILYDRRSIEAYLERHAKEAFGR